MPYFTRHRDRRRQHKPAGRRPPASAPAGVAGAPCGCGRVGTPKTERLLPRTEATPDCARDRAAGAVLSQACRASFNRRGAGFFRWRSERAPSWASPTFAGQHQVHRLTRLGPGAQALAGVLNRCPPWRATPRKAGSQPSPAVWPVQKGSPSRPCVAVGTGRGEGFP